MNPQSLTLRKNFGTHRIFSQLFSFTLRHKLRLSEYSPSRLDAPEAQSVLCLSVLERAAQARTHISAWGTASLVWIVHSTFYYQTCPAI